MIWSDWNKADRTLLLALVLFFFALCIHLQYPGRVVADGFLFCAEAALVGGIADWFAVTALFRKPLGFPYHTAILPRRRTAFIQASVQMVQREFFSKRKIFRHLEHLRLFPLLMGWLAKKDTEDRLVRQMMHEVRSVLFSQDMQVQASELARHLRAALSRVPPDQLAILLERWFRHDGRDKVFLMRLAEYLKGRASSDQTRQFLIHQFEAYGKQNMKDHPMAAFFVGLAQAVDLVNYEEAAVLTQRQILSALEKLSVPDSDLQRRVLTLLYDQADQLRQEPHWRQMLCGIRDGLLDELPWEQIVGRVWGQFRDTLCGDTKKSWGEAGFSLHLEELLRREYRHMLWIMETKPQLHQQLERFLYDLIARSALHAQTLIGVIVTQVLSRLTDEQLNHLVYDKVEPDLLWIRMNGSIVGAGIGLLLFVSLRFLAY
ncbi:DUF445 family protein [Selenomonas montiformis]|uniref:DUF445 family protein n=1 Tax=Selenomonas montiformis TaxID=2652285 RepID=UPI0039F49360